MTTPENTEQTPPEHAQHVSPSEPIANGSSRFFVPFFQTGRADDDFGDVNRLVLHYVQDRLEQVVTTPPEETEIDVWIDSPGGSASVAYKIILNLQHRCRKLRFVVPDFAKSAATLMVLGSDEIFMSPAAELGPLDAQIEHPDREGVQVSALEVARIFDFLGRFASDYVISGGAKVLHWTRLPRADVLREFLKFTAVFLEPAMAKLDPHLIYRAKNELDLAKHYAHRVLRNRRLSPEDEGRNFDAVEFADHIVGHYPVHEFVITKAEAEEFGLPGIRDAYSYDKWNYVHGIYREFRLSMLVNETAESIVDVWDEEEMVEKFSENNRDNGPEEANNKE